jgi:hypothetical protein
VCGRAACLVCAVPVRGEVLCVSCAAREVGAPPPPEPVPAPAGRRSDVVAGILLGLALVATAPPWDRFGALTSPFSAWDASPEPWTLLACILVAAAALAAAARLGILPIHPTPRAGRITYGLLALAAAAATAQALLASPDYVSHTPAVYVTLVGAFGAAVIGLLRQRP